MKRIFTIGSLALLALISANTRVLAGEADLVDTLRQEGEFSTLLYAVEQAGLTETLRKAEALTIFAPTDKAFKQVPKQTLTKILEDKKLLTKVLTYHVVAGMQTGAKLVKKSAWASLAGAKIDVTAKPAGVFIDGYKVEAANIKARNGLIHKIGSVLNPTAILVADYFPLKQTGALSYRKTLDRGLFGGKKVETLVRYPQLSAQQLTVKDSEAEYQQFLNSGQGPAMKSQSMTDQGFVQEYHPALPMFPRKQVIGSKRSFASVVHHKTRSETTLGAIQRNVTLLGYETIKTPAGTFKDCLKFKVTSYNRPDVAGQFLAKSIDTVWLAKSVGEVKTVSNVTLSQFNVPFIKAKLMFELLEMPKEEQSKTNQPKPSNENSGIKARQDRKLY